MTAVPVPPDPAGPGHRDPREVPPTATRFRVVELWPLPVRTIICGYVEGDGAIRPRDRLRDPETGNVLTVLGIDLHASRRTPEGIQHCLVLPMDQRDLVRTGAVLTRLPREATA